MEIENVHCKIVSHLFFSLMSSDDTVTLSPVFRCGVCVYPRLYHLRDLWRAGLIHFPLLKLLLHPVESSAFVGLLRAHEAVCGSELALSADRG